jgi:hypothetical protein
MQTKIYPLDSIKPGIQRDGTTFDSDCWTDGKWTRFQRGRPRKMGGYVEIQQFNNIQRGVYMVPYSPNFNAYFGDYKSLSYLTLPRSGLPPVTNLIDRTPAFFRADLNNDWIFGTMYDGASNNAILVAHAAPNLYTIDSPVETPIYYGNLLGSTPLIPTALQASGGVVVVSPFIVGYGNYGNITFSAALDPTNINPDIPNDLRVTSQKIVYGLPTRGGNSSPAAIFWSLDSVIRMTNVGNDTFTPSFDTVTSESSILSSRGVIEYDGLYFWAGIDRFLVYNGTVSEVPNDKSINYFFDNLNYAQSQKVWATKVPRFGEIWWHFPKGDSMECNHAIVYNLRDNTWYDTEIHRSDGYFNQTFSKPLWCDSEQNDNGTYSVWMHETGVDKVYLDQTVVTIPAYIESSAISFVATDASGQRAGIDKLVNFERFEPDFVQSGSMTLSVGGKEYANSTAITPETADFTSDTTKIDVHVQVRELTIRLDSPSINNPTEVGNDFQMGQCLVVLGLGDTRP